jgi:hypothetical protein
VTQKRKFDALSFRKARLAAPILLAGLLAMTACSDRTSPLTPSSGEVVPVGRAEELKGRWTGTDLFAQGLPASAYLIPAFTAGRFNSRIFSHEFDLTASVTGPNTRLFAVSATGAAADTADPALQARNSFEIWGSFQVGEDGALTVSIHSEQAVGAAAPSYTGSAGLLADTLLLTFTLSAPPGKAVGFLPDTTAFIARLVRRPEAAF